MTAIMFSGQGAQKNGMGKELYYNFPICRRTFDEASEAAGFDMAKLCFRENELLNRTEYAQPALLTAGIAAYRLFVEREGPPDILMGLSLGEYTALTAAGVFNFADAVRLVHRRGKITAEHAGDGGILVSIGIASDVLEEICRNVTGFAACANYNTPEQTVLAGEHTALEACAAEIKKAGGKTMPLKVSGPFHSPLMGKAAEIFKGKLESITAQASVDNHPRIISNVDAEIFNPEQYIEILTKHMTSPVRWLDCVQKAISMGADTFIELGSGKTLVNFVKKIDNSVKTYAFEEATT